MIEYIINKRKIIKITILLSLSVVGLVGFFMETVLVLALVPVALWLIMSYK